MGDRQIIDAALVTNEVVDDVHRRWRKGLVLKLDFGKSYTRVNLSFFG